VICDPGNYLVRFFLPADIPSGDTPVSIEVPGFRSDPVILVVGAAGVGPAVGYLQSVLDSRVRRIAPGMVVNVVGGGFVSVAGGLTQCSINLSYWPTKCQDLTVTINGYQAAIQIVTPNYITVQMPFEVSAGAATLVVERTVGAATLRSQPLNFALEAFSPTIPANSPSNYAGVVIENSGGVASRTNPLIPGDRVIIYADGLGQTNPPMVTGFPLIQPAATVLTPSISVGGKPLENVQSLVLPGTIGQYRITATVPGGLATGDLPIVLEIGGKKSQDGLLVPVANEPVIAGVTNGASGSPDIVSGSWVSIYGRNLSATRREWTENDITYDWLPTALDGVHVDINNTPAVVAFVSPTQLNVLAPDNLPAGPVEVSVKGPLGTQKATANVKSYAPGLFPLNVPPGNLVLAMHADWSYVARTGQLPLNVASRPAKPRETIVFYGTGFGHTDPAATMYYRFSGSATLAGSPPVRVQIGPLSAEVAYVGLVTNGTYQVNVVVPDLPDGDHEVIVSMGAESSPRGRYIPVQR
jgi:uncharacterized protein (TIGR03437 family)